MKIYLENNSYYYEIEKLTRAFFPNEKLSEEQGFPETPEEPYVRIGVFEVNDEQNEIIAEVCVGDFHEILSTQTSVSDDTELAAAQLLYKLLVKLTGVEQPWGLLTGVRPIKLFRKLKQEMGEEQTKLHFQREFFVSAEKAALAAETERREAEILKLTEDNSFSLYIAVPFCPSRCSYCSFVSAPTGKTKKLIEPYTQLLCRELEETAKIAERCGLHLESVYMGGGTPTTLSADQLRRVFSVVQSRFDMSGCREFTVEAGRPETIDEDKLLAMKEFAVDRISINPQTLSDEVLEAIGRRHTCEDFYSAFELARKLGFDHINTDLIAGLPKDTPDSFRETLVRLTKLSPESITVHTLAMKRASDLTQSGKMIDKKEASAVVEMHSDADRMLHENGYSPYYLYRQSRMVGNLENTGWAKPGKEGYYNVFIMAETQPIIACGAGAVTKLCRGNSPIERIFNYKYPYEYIDSFETVLERKKGIGEFYDKFR